MSDFMRVKKTLIEQMHDVFYRAVDTRVVFKRLSLSVIFTRRQKIDRAYTLLSHNSFRRVLFLFHLS